MGWPHPGVGDIILWGGFPHRKGESEWNSCLLSLLPAGESHVTSHGFPPPWTLFLLILWGKINVPSFKLLCQVFCPNNEDSDCRSSHLHLPGRQYPRTSASVAATQPGFHQFLILILLITKATRYPCVCMCIICVCVTQKLKLFHFMKRLL